MEILNYILEQALILIPVLYVIGAIIKGIPGIPNWIIPFVLLVFGVGGAIGIMGVSVESVIQGILVTGATVLVNQGVKQITIGREADNAIERNEG